METKNNCEIVILKELIFSGYTLEISIDQGIKESQQGEVMQHDQVMKEIRGRYRV